MTRSRCLVTGATGFLGRHVIRAFDVAGIQTVTTARRSEEVDVAGDLRDATFASRLVRQASPSHVVHLAGSTTAGDGDHIATNAQATNHLLRAVAELAPGAWVMIASSSAVYGQPVLLPVTEDHPFAPRSVYAASKAAQELLAASYAASDGMRVAALRFFNLVGPGQPDGLVLAGLARQVATLEHGGSGSGTIRVGNVAPRRDFVDVRDAASAVVEALRSEITGPFNVASGFAVAIAHLLEELRKRASRQLDVTIADVRPEGVEIMEQRGDSARLRAATAWRPTVSLDETIDDVLAEWRQSVARGATT